MAGPTLPPVSPGAPASRVAPSDASVNNAPVQGRDDVGPWQPGAKRKQRPADTAFRAAVVSPEDLAQSKVRALMGSPQALVSALAAEPNNDLLLSTAMGALQTRSNLSPFVAAAAQNPAAAPLRAALAMEESRRAFEKLGPSTTTTAVSGAPHAVAAAVSSGLKAKLGPGNPAALAAFTQAHASDLERLDQVAQGPAKAGAPGIFFAAEALKPPGGRVDFVLADRSPPPQLGAEPVMVQTTAADGQRRLYAVPSKLPRESLDMALGSNGKLAQSFASAWKATWPQEPLQGGRVLVGMADDEHLLKTVAALPANDRDALFRAMAPKGTLGGLAVQVRDTALTYASVEAGTRTVRTSVDGVPDLERLSSFAKDNGTKLYAPTFQRYAERAEPESVRGADVDNLVGMAMQLPMKKALSDAKYTPKEGEAFYDGASEKLIAPIAEQVRKIAATRGAGAPADVTLLPVVLTTPNGQALEVPLFKVKGSAGDEYVDTSGRRYPSFQDWTKTNPLPPGVMTFPKDGVLRSDGSGAVATQSANTPRTIDTPEERAQVAAGKVAQVGGMVIGGMLLFGTGGTAALVGGAALSVYGATQSGAALIDRANHGQSISLANAEARQDWYGVGSSALALTGLGARGLAAVAPKAAVVAHAASIGANVIAATSIAEDAVALVRSDQLSGQDRVALAANVAMYGAFARAAGGPKTMFNFRQLRGQLLQPAAAVSVAPGAVAR